jgi:hypothetical protein
LSHTWRTRTEISASRLLGRSDIGDAQSDTRDCRS